VFTGSLPSKRVISANFKKYLQCVLAARIFIVDFVVCTLAVKKKSGQVSTCRIIRPFPCQFKTTGSVLKAKIFRKSVDLSKEFLVHEFFVDVQRNLPLVRASVIAVSKNVV
jgi:hypothetical protein